MERNFRLDADYAKEMDRGDKLKSFKERFYLGEGELYFDGNSLGPFSKDAEEAVYNMLDVWKREKILMWNIEDGR